MDTKKLNTKLDLNLEKKPAVIKTQESHVPEKRFNAGAIAVTVWNNVVDKSGVEKNYRTISFERRYLDKATNEWKSTNSLRINDLPKASLILDRAYEYIVLKEKDSGNALPEDDS